MKRRWISAGACLVIAIAALLIRLLWRDEAAPSSIPATKSIATAKFADDVAPLIDRYCCKCHSGSKPKGNLALDKYRDELAVARDFSTWEKVARHVREHEMPPADNPQPSVSEAAFLTTWIDTTITRLNCRGDKSPGRVTLRRLNRAEYNNTIRDLIGIDFKPADDFPADDVSEFDNLGDILSISPLLLEKYVAAAEDIVTRAWSSPKTRKQILFCELKGQKEDEFAAKIIERFAERAYRRPVTPLEIDRLLHLVKRSRSRGQNLDQALKLAVQAILSSPHFIFRVENEPETEGSALINEFELATRLSYFLWSSMPNDELFRLARQGALRANLDGQVRRMLADPKSQALSQNFASQWLQTRGLLTATPNREQFPNFDEDLRRAMLQETENFFLDILRNEGSSLAFLDADYTFVNERLARHYGIAGIKGNEFRRVSLQTKERGGLVTQASILTATSHPTRTSPVKRGKWILENILGTPPPPPLPDAGQLNDSKEAVLASSLRQRMEQHRAKPACASCHQRLDPLGFALENYDGIGAWRDHDGAFTIDAVGVLPSGESFNGPSELKKVLLRRKDEFCRCLCKKMLTYAVGREMKASDECFIAKIARSAAEDNYKLSRIVIEVARSRPFQEREPAGEEE